ncbi:hypothetical protein [Bacillus thuringiensis]|uniref:hypothetical protein n=1 Tax=Bacillus thuringiensis TaxID=1428 RepID=UPI0011A82E39|nr:hypothetical protein [Bacillus thuringiensis]
MHVIEKPKNLFFAFWIAVLLILPFIQIQAHAEESVTTNKVEAISRDAINTNSKKFDYSPDKEVPSVSIDQANSWAERKGYDVVKFLQTFVQPLAVIAFIIFAFVALFGFIGKGLLGMGVSVLVYTGVLFAPELLNFFSRWLSS